MLFDGTEKRVESGKDARRLADAEAEKREAMKAEIEAMFARRAAARYLFSERWGRYGCAYSK